MQMEHIGRDLLVSDFPPELLDRIFELYERGHIVLEHHRGPWSDWDLPTFLPKSHLHPLLLVCKRWHPVAERRLYTSVSLGSDRIVNTGIGEWIEIKGKDVCRRFWETLKNDARIASIVRELRMGSTSADREESEIHVRLIGMCENVEKISHYGCHPLVLGDLAVALTQADLVSLELSYEQLGDHQSGTMLSLRNLIDLLCEWPRLQRLRIKMTEDNYDVLPPRVTLVPGLSTELKQVDIYGRPFDRTQLKHLQDLSPSLEDLSVTVGEDCGPELRQCIQAWSSSLKRLRVSRTSEPFPPYNFLPVIQNPMPKLRELYMPSPLLAASALVFLPMLEKLGFYAGEYSQGMELARLIERGVMPCLQEVEVFFLSAMAIEDPEMFGVYSDEDERAEIEAYHEVRKVCGERGILVKGCFTETKWIVA